MTNSKVVYFNIMLVFQYLFGETESTHGTPQAVKSDFVLNRGPLEHKAKEVTNCDDRMHAFWTSSLDRGE
jgi:hypothetical protein